MIDCFSDPRWMIGCELREFVRSGNARSSLEVVVVMTGGGWRGRKFGCAVCKSCDPRSNVKDMVASEMWVWAAGPRDANDKFGPQEMGS